MSIEKAGYVPAEFTVSGAVIRAGASTVLPPPIVVNQNLFAPGAIPDGMVFVPGGDYRLVNWSRPTETRVKLNDFFIDRYEVSNRDFQEFIAAGGYLKKQYLAAAVRERRQDADMGRGHEGAGRSHRLRRGRAVGPGQTFPEGEGGSSRDRHYVV